MAVKELSDADVFGTRELSDADVFDAPPEPGVLGTIGGAASAGISSAVKSVTGLAAPFKDQSRDYADENPPPPVLAKPFSEGWSDPKWWAAQITHGITSSAPALAAGAAGTAVAGPIGGIAGFALGAAAQSLAPAYQKARQDGLSHDDAVTRAFEESGIAGGFGALMGAAPGLAAFGRTAAGALKRPISEALAQIFGVQPGLGAAQQVATGAVEGKMPTADELATGAAGNIGMGAVMTGAHAALRGRTGERPAETAVDVPPETPRTTEPPADAGAPPPWVPPSRGRVEPDPDTMSWRVYDDQGNAVGEPYRNQADAEAARLGLAPPPPPKPEVVETENAAARVAADAAASTPLAEPSTATAVRREPVPAGEAPPRPATATLGMGEPAGSPASGPSVGDVTVPGAVPLASARPDSRPPVFQRPDEPAPVFYSGLTRAVEAMRQPKAGMGQWLAMLRNAPGVKPDELAWSGVEDWLKQRPGQVTREELLDFLRANEVKVQEVVKGAPARVAPEPTPPPRLKEINDQVEEINNKLTWMDVGPARDALFKERNALDKEARPLMEAWRDTYDAWIGSNKATDTKFSDYTIPGGENYRELLLTMPNTRYKPVRMASGRYAVRDTKANQFLRDPSGAGKTWGTLDEANAEIAHQGAVGNVGDEYHSGHFDEPNILAHIRFNERTDAEGRKVLHVEEIQSDWHQKGRKSGYKADRDALMADVIAKEKASIIAHQLDRPDKAERLAAYREANARLEAFESNGSAVPDAPFKTQWPELAFKRVLRWAADHDFDRVTWTTGETQAARYDLSKQVDRIKWSKPDPAGKETYVVVYGKDGGAPIASGHWTDAQIADNLGKEIAEKITKAESGTLSGDGLKVGGEGMKGFYDKIIPAIAGKIGKRFGAKVGRAEVRAETDERTMLDDGEIIDAGKRGAPTTATVHSIDITPEMRESVQSGQPLWQRNERAGRATEPPAAPGEVRIARGLMGTPALTERFTRAEGRMVEAVNRVLTRMAPQAKGRGYGSMRATAETGKADEIYGAYFKDGKDAAPVIAWSLRSPDAVGTARHEALHHLKQSGLIAPHEWATLEKAATDGGWIADHKIKRRYPGISDAAAAEEAVAEQFAAWRRDRGMSLPRPIRELFHRIDLFLRRVAAAAREIMGRDVTAEDIFTAIESGRVGRRGMAGRQAPTGGVSYARDTEPPVPRGMTRLYRGETDHPGGNVPDYVRETPEFKATVDATGRWFSADREAAEYYDKTFGDGTGRISYVDVPSKDVAGYLSENQPSARKFSALGRASEEYFVPKDIAAARKRLGETPSFSRPAAPATRPDIERRARALATTLRGHMAEMLAPLAEEAQLKVTPMAAGSDAARAVAKDFANWMREARYEGARAMDALTKDFTPEQLGRMWRAADAESVARQTGATTTEGLASLAQAERAAVLRMQGDADGAFKIARDMGMVESEGLPSYVPRMIVEMAAGGAKRVGNMGEQAKALNAIGRNLKTTTGQLKKRQHLTAEATEAAAKARFGDAVSVVQDFRTLPLATMKLREAMAGRALINQIKEIGRKTGADTVVEGADPSSPDQKWFTIDHPAFKTWRPKFDREGKAVKDENGETVLEKVPLYVRGDFEGPLRSVLTGESEKLYKAMMDLKGKTMGLIMYSPLIHNGVEWGRALPAMPGKVVTFKIYFEGNRAKHDPAQMREAIRAGMVPIGHRGQFQDITSIASMPDLKPGRSWTSQVLAAIPGLFDPRAGDAVKRTVDKMGDFWHNTLLWDRVADLQMGLYTNLRDQLVAEGKDPQSAQRVAAHLANRYAGALPQEAMSSGAQKIANLALFSRTFTLGNLGAMKDMLTGLPRDVQAQILRDKGAKALDNIRSYAKRKAIATVALDIGLMYVGNSILQSSIAMLSGDSTLDKEAQGYVRRLGALFARGRDNPMSLMNPFDDVTSVTPMGENEPGKKDRVYIGRSQDGTAIYMRNPAGKIGEEFIGWMTGPLDMVKRKLGTLARPTLALISNDQGFGRKVYDPKGSMLDALGNIVSMYMGDQIPLQSIQAAKDYFTGHGDPTVNLAQSAGPLAGITFSKGAPGGPAVGAMYEARSQHDFAVQKALPDIRRKIQDGDTSGAVQDMKRLGIPPGLQQFYIRTTKNPKTRLSPTQLKQFMQYATPDQRDEMQRFLGQR